MLAADGRIAELQRSGADLTSKLVLAPEVTPAPVSFPEAVADPSTLGSPNTNNLLQLARKLHDEHVREGMVKRDELIAEGHATAARVVREAEASQRSDMNRLQQEKAVIEHSIQQLRTFEREYRTRLKSYIESQLTELGSAGVAPRQEAPGYTPGIGG
jgi:hypothetical protein